MVTVNKKDNQVFVMSVKNMAKAFILGAVLVLMPGAWETAESVRLKDVASFSGVHENRLIGYGLVVGLDGTGDDGDTPFTVSSMANMLEGMGISVHPADLDSDNVAAVMVTANMPASAKPGSDLDITVSSIGDADSLLGGVLVQTPLRGVDGDIYALAQGQLTVGGFSAEGEAAEITTNVPTVARIPGGATVEKGVPYDFNTQDHVVVNLEMQDFSTTSQVTESINQHFDQNLAYAEDISTVKVDIPQEFQGNLVPFMAALENLQVTPDQPARVVVDERTGTVVIGEQVRLSRVAVSHGALTVMVREVPEVFMPLPFTEAEPVIAPETEIEVVEEEAHLELIEGATINELVDGLNAIGATPRDLISILRTLKASGALHAELEVI